MTTRDEELEKLSKLTDRERQVLRGFCEGVDQDDVSAALNIVVATVKTHIKNVRIKLEVDHLQPGKQDQIIRERYCPLIRDMEPWPPKIPAEEPPQNMNSTNVGPTTPIQGSHRGWRILALILIALALGIFVGIFLGARLLGQLGSAQTPNLVSDNTRIVTKEVPVTMVISTTPEPTKPASAPVIQRETIIVQQVITAVVTATPPPTQPATSTPLPSDTPTPAPLFEDTFTGGMSKSWKVEYGNPIPVNDALTFDQTTLISVGENDWKNYVVTFEVSKMYCQYAVEDRKVIIVVRYQDANNMVALRWSKCGGIWSTVENGKGKGVTNTDFTLPPPFAGGVYHPEVTANGNQFTLTSGPYFVNDKHPSGKVAIIADAGVIIDNVVVTALP